MNNQEYERQKRANAVAANRQEAIVQNFVRGEEMFDAGIARQTDPAIIKRLEAAKATHGILMTEDEKRAANRRYLIWCEICWERMDKHEDRGNCTTTTTDGRAGSYACWAARQVEPEPRFWFAEDGYSDGGERYSDEELEQINAPYFAKYGRGV